MTDLGLKNRIIMCHRTLIYRLVGIVAASIVALTAVQCTTSGHDDFDAEPGIEHGVSAAFGGVSGNFVVRAGGCNFPDDPLGADSKKRYYQGVYVLNPAEPDGEWKRVGNLPKCIAYGASATTHKGVVMAGGITADGSTAKVWLARVDETGKPEISSLPELPFALDNTAACADENTMYVCGGNVDGKPSNVLLCLNLDRQGEGWQRLADFPGNGRIQPVVAVTQSRVYVWGGFAPKGENREATLDTGGYCYEILDKEWKVVPGPTDDTGYEVSLGGGVAVTLADGRIAATGGVNRDVFLSALRQQPADYLQHPKEWYRFNPTVYIFDPDSCTWSAEATSADYARAGAAAALWGDSLFILGGELKPRIRTPKTAVLKISAK